MSKPTASSRDVRPVNQVRTSTSLSKAVHYYGWVVSRIRRYLGRNVLDIGSGYGTHLQHIIPLVDRITTIHLSAENVEYLNRKFQGHKQFRAVCADFTQSPIPGWLKSSRFDTILCLNILEHYENDLVALRQMNEMLPLGQGVLILQVPAHPGLYGTLDNRAGHFRRYTKSDLATKLEQSGFKISHIEYFNRLSALFWWLNSRVFKRRLNSKMVNFQIDVYDRILVPILKPLESILPLPFGQSLLVTAVKQRENNR